MDFRRIFASLAMAALLLSPIGLIVPTIARAADTSPATTTPFIETAHLPSPSSASWLKTFSLVRPVFETFFGALWSVVSRAFHALAVMFKNLDASLQPQPEKNLINAPPASANVQIP